MCGIWNLAAVIGHRKSAAGVLDFVRDEDDTTLERLDEALFCSLSTAFSDIYVRYACVTARKDLCQAVQH